MRKLSAALFSNLNTYFAVFQVKAGIGWILCLVSFWPRQLCKSIKSANLRNSLGTRVYINLRLAPCTHDPEVSRQQVLAGFTI